MRRMSLRPTRAGTVVLCALAFFAGCVALTAWQEPQPLQRGFIAGLMLCTSGMLLFAFGRFATALLVGGGLFLLLKSVAVLKLRYLDSQLMPSDFIYYVRSSLLDTLRHYPHLYTVGIGLGVLLPPLLYLVWRWDWRVLERLRSRRVAGVRLGGVASCALALWLCMLPSGPFARVHSRNAWQKMSDDAQLTNFFVNLHDADVELPAMADDAVAEQDWGATAQGAPGSTSPYPDIVQVLEESTFDPSIYDACNVPACRVAMFRPDARTRAHGMLRVHTFGGGTWVSEFAALTGMPQDIFGPGGMYAPYVLAPNVRDALALQLRRLGYLTIGVYPTSADFINGRNAYQAYGFDHLYGADELGLEEWEESDAQMFAAAGRLYDKLKKPGQPVFLMILTLNQHGPHDHQPMATLPKPYRNLLRGLSRDAALNFDAYLARLHASDTAMHALEHAFLDRPQPTVLLHFGDHQPSFNGLIRNLPRRLPPALQPYRDYLTYYMLKSNFAGPPLPQYPLLDIAFLPSMVLEAAGVPTDAYFAASTGLRERCDGRYDDCAVPGLLASYHAWTIGRLHVYQ
ncbi:sulfatase-like hydrolase/transferase [Rhodanobacter denitrificans]|uniref:Phosphoglycerol transferase family protein, alkaline phosphatase superfamily n=1 Tax=Rhodanobacter denitrificans TaxID=666685 RepID=M4NIG6_9GAMM|nr:sulfatase-like hydrolase/transferase [Rhodanobacter denitrificans]AGG90694.1 phosphoglycerol transferase family protein, alkaline phosphatase superfamily [Rhodanobacter denitrificans]UJM86076.1 sulfatase-like hydrolase/transferase [Rhodanobacter denitrificans]